MSILFISNPYEDAHLRPVLLELYRRGLDVQFFDPGAFPLSATVTVDSSPLGPRAFINWEQQEIDLASVRSVWYRRPNNFTLPEELERAEDKWIRDECSALINGIYANTAALWVNEPFSIRRADLKLWQLRLAQQLGFRIPDYTITNSPERARTFLAAHPEGVIVKGLWMPTILLDDRAGMIYTHLVTPEDVELLETVRYGPTFLQALVPKARDIRVTVIGDQIFPAGIDSLAVVESRIDFRKAEIMDLPHGPVTLPEPVAAACLAIVKELGLQFGAIDLLETPEGDYVFLENNPNGQWYWVEMMTGQPMARAMADLLERGDRGTVSTPLPRPPREPRSVPVGQQTVALPRHLVDQIPDADNGGLHLAATRAWIEQKKKRLYLHVGDVDQADATNGRPEQSDVSQNGKTRLESVSKEV